MSQSHPDSISKELGKEMEVLSAMTASMDINKDTLVPVQNNHTTVSKPSNSETKRAAIERKTNPHSEPKGTENAPKASSVKVVEPPPDDNVFDNVRVRALFGEPLPSKTWRDWTMTDIYIAMERLISHATKSVCMIMFAFGGGTEAFKIVKLLKDAKAETVRVILDHGQLFQKTSSYNESRSLLRNAIKSSNGRILCRVLQGATRGSYFGHMHEKLIIADGERLILGSANMSSSTFSNNYETALEIEHTGLAQHYVTHFEHLWEKAQDFTRIPEPSSSKPARGVASYDEAEE